MIVDRGTSDLEYELGLAVEQDRIRGWQVGYDDGTCSIYGFLLGTTIRVVGDTVLDVMTEMVAREEGLNGPLSPE
jgi:hypothetical protein